MILPFLIFAQLGVVQFHTGVSPDTVFVGQQVSYDAATLVDDVARSRLRANPSYTPAEVRGVSVYDFPFDTAAIADVNIGGAHFRRYLYHRALFPLTPGIYDVPPATLQYALPDDDVLGSEPRSYALLSEPTQFVALPLPGAGRPLDFTGAVGAFNDTSYTDGATPRVGDTFVFTVRVSGVGDINLLPRPVLSIPWASAVEGEERVTWDSAGTVVRGAKEFDWIVTPKLRGEMIMPTVRYPYFNPTTKRYSTATTPSFTLTVEAQGSDAAVVPRQAPPPPDAIGDSPFPIIVAAIRDNPILSAGIAAFVLVFLIGAVVWIRHRPSDE